MTSTHRTSWHAALTQTAPDPQLPKRHSCEMQRPFAQSVLEAQATPAHANGLQVTPSQTSPTPHVVVAPHEVP